MPSVINERRPREDAGSTATAPVVCDRSLSWHDDGDYGYDEAHLFRRLTNCTRPDTTCVNLRHHAERREMQK
jgi:hypothetical protein